MSIFPTKLLAGVAILATLAVGPLIAQSSHHGERPPLPKPEELKKLPPDGGPRWNRLVFEQSPYLQQHAANPVDWFPWGPEAFEKAKRENKPVFLSIGYATCHWCHVMERESFEDAEVAKILNEHFVPVKVDREERPDIDKIYMTVCQAMTGQGGWPLTVVLTPDKKPFFAGTYFPKTARLGRPGMMELLPKLHDAWQNQKVQVVLMADQVTDMLRRHMGSGEKGTFKDDAVAAAYQSLAGSFDAEFGGFGSAPKFPTPHNLMLLLRHWKRTGDAEALKMVEKTLIAMRHGGIFDHLGYGFHRYATDREWLVPHFEKMLYDQALLALAYLEAFQATRNPLFEETARHVFEYVRRDMRSPEGGFYSAEDAESEGEEGKFYFWTKAEIDRALDKESAELVRAAFGVTDSGNYVEKTGTGVTVTGTNILHRVKRDEELAKKHGLTVQVVRERLERARTALLKQRDARIRPLKDDKILTDWNGLMMAAFARGAAVLEEPSYLKTARDCADFLLSELRTTDGLLLKRYRAGTAGLDGQLDDYVFLAWGLIELYEASFETRYLKAAMDLSHKTIELFSDEAGGFYLTAVHAEALLVRPKTFYDGAIPSGNSVAAWNMARLGRMTGDSAWEKRVEDLLNHFAGSGNPPQGSTFLLMAHEFMRGPSFEVVLVGSAGAGDLKALKKALYTDFIPHKVVVFRPMKDDPITEIAPYTKFQKTIGNAATVYVCRNFACKAPTTEVSVMLESLKGK
ncbi:Thioredoxin domain-containing protein [Sulfidibacter corallicola]|uniref:Thioredoxin domain-containing protein n=1 Tax=Sulfidibacter corallicola TaxID=2818388 RepID=A0A8A4TNV4_SULCO|nr:thioredoxin domain-containing protein [Sulfidibacter corallicola]QTD48265.1 thioredoxin domain-containing protein [Sulfidibacter corallicola]